MLRSRLSVLVITGRDVFVNGVAVVRNGQHTGAKPGMIVRGPGWTGRAEPTRPILQE